jgi:methyl-accepting chemotaxis protein
MNTTQVNSMQSPRQPDDLSVSLLAKQSADAPPVRSARSKNDRLPVKSSRRLLAFARYVTVLLIGVAATLAWQTYGDLARHMIALVVFSQDQQQFNSTSPDLNAVRQGIDQLAARFASNQEQIMRNIANNQDRIMRSVDQVTTGLEQMTREIAKLQAVDQSVAYKSPDTPTGPAPPPVPKPALRQSQKPAALAPAKNP